MEFRKLAPTKQIVIPVIVTLLLIFIWEAAVDTGVIANFLLPSPLQVLRALIRDQNLLYTHGITTMTEAILGLFWGCVLGFIVAILMDSSPFIHAALNPLITISQTIPTIAIAPLLVLWLG